MCGPIWSIRRGASKAFLTAQHSAWIASQHPDRSLSPNPGSISLTRRLGCRNSMAGSGSVSKASTACDQRTRGPSTSRCPGPAPVPCAGKELRSPARPRDIIARNRLFFARSRLATEWGGVCGRRMTRAPFVPCEARVCAINPPSPTPLPLNLQLLAPRLFASNPPPRRWLWAPPEPGPVPQQRGHTF